MPENRDVRALVSEEDANGNESENNNDLNSESCCGISSSIESCCDCEKELQKLRDELEHTKAELLRQTMKCRELMNMQEALDGEIHELTGSLFQEAYNKVNLASEQQEKTEKLLKEANGKIEVLQAEVNALKMLFLSSTPSTYKTFGAGSPTQQSKAKGTKSTALSSHRRIRSDVVHADLEHLQQDEMAVRFQLGNRHVDLVQMRSLESWRVSGLHEKNHPFWETMYKDLLACLEFASNDLVESIIQAAEANTVIIEPSTDDAHEICELSQVPGHCKYRVKLTESDQWYYVSPLCRDRLAAVCDLLTYVRYIKQGLVVKSSNEDVYWHIMRLRKQVALARLGITYSV